MSVALNLAIGILQHYVILFVSLFLARDPCHSFKCSENSICQVLPTTRTAVCVCKRGYRRHTDGGCIGKDNKFAK